MRSLFRRLRYVIWHRRFDAELREELELHREMAAREREFNGVSPDDARWESQRLLGNDALAREQARDVWNWPWLQDVSQDLRFAIRVLLKDRRFTAAAVVALGLGIGVNNTIFTLVNAALIRDLPFDDPDRLVSVDTLDATGRRGRLSYADYEDLRNAASAFAGIAASAGASMNISDDERAPERLRGTFVSANTFNLLRSDPLLGRGFVPDDDRGGATPVVILSYGIWNSRYGANREVIGRTVRINDVPSVVVGVMPPRFQFPLVTEAWQPLSLLPDLGTAEPDARRLNVIGRLADSADLSQARAEIAPMAARLARGRPGASSEMSFAITPLSDSHGGPGLRAILMTLMGAVVFVLLIACANVANLLLARSAHRSREVAVRAALGASRWRIVRQLLIECAVIAVLAAMLGLVLSVFGVRFLATGFNVMEAGAPADAVRPYWLDLSMNGAAYAFLGVLSLMTTLGFGLVPAWQMSRPGVNDILKDGSRSQTAGRRARRWTGAFIVAEIAMTLILLVGAGLLWRSFLTKQAAALVIDTSGVVTMRLTLPAQKYGTPRQRTQFLGRLDRRLASISAFSSATMASASPLERGAPRELAIDYRRPEGDEAPPTVAYVSTGARYFETLKLPIARGRTFTRADSEVGHEGAIVDQRFADVFFPGHDALGHRIRVSGTAGPRTSSPWMVIVGIVPTVSQSGPPPGAPAPVVYAPIGVEPAPQAFASIVVRGAPLSAVTQQLRDEVRALDSDLPLYSIEALDDAVARRRAPQLLIGGWLGILAGIALVLASVGLYGVTAHGVAERTQEVGIRIALGAGTRQVVWLFVRRTALQLCIGLALGLAGALAVGQLLRAFLVQTEPRDPITLALVTTVLTATALAASVLPARRAARVDPAVALRAE